MASPTTNVSPQVSGQRDVVRLAPILAIVFLAFLSVGAPLPTLSLYVRDDLGFGNVAVGWVVGLQSIVTVIVRDRSGIVCDRFGPHRVVFIGLPLAALSGVLYFASAWKGFEPAVRLGLLLIGRVMLGVGESLFLVGTMTWGIARVGSARTGKVMAWQGIALYGALGLGAPLGLALMSAVGFQGVALLAIISPSLALLIATLLPQEPAGGKRQRMPLRHIIGLMWLPGMVQLLSTIPFASMATFLVLAYRARGWTGPEVALAAFPAGYILVRLVGAHLPDRFGGLLVASISLPVELAGQVILWLAPTPAVAAIGAALTGIGFSLIFPCMGVEATRRVPSQERGRAVGNFMMFFDLAIGLAGPLVGGITGCFGYGMAFAVGTASCLAALLILPLLHRAPSAPAPIT